MAYRFKRKESVAKAVRRLGCEQIEHAFGCLEDVEDAEAVHCARKDIKKVRAVLRLVRSCVRKKEFRKLTRGFREAAELLAPVRDAYVKTEALRRLVGCYPA